MYYPTAQNITDYDMQFLNFFNERQHLAENKKYTSDISCRMNFEVNRRVIV